MTVRLSLLDQSPVGHGMAPDEALADTLHRAQFAEEQGFDRVWFAEHHRTAAFAGTTPLTMAALALARTRTIRIGTGGVLLAYQDPTQVAECFTTLARLHPDRVDAGVGRAGADPTVYREKVATLVRGLAADTAVPVWVLGTGPSSARLARDLGASFAYGHFFNPSRTGRAFEVLGSDVEALVAVRVVAHEDPDVAQALAERFLVWRALRDLGVDAPFPRLLGSQALRDEPRIAERVAANASGVFSGTPRQVADAVRRLAARHSIDEVVLTVPIPERELALTAIAGISRAIHEMDAARG